MAIKIRHIEHCPQTTIYYMMVLYSAWTLSSALTFVTLKTPPIVIIHTNVVSTHIYAIYKYIRRDHHRHIGNDATSDTAGAGLEGGGWMCARGSSTVVNIYDCRTTVWRFICIASNVCCVFGSCAIYSNNFQLTNVFRGNIPERGRQIWVTQGWLDPVSVYLYVILCRYGWKVRADFGDWRHISCLSNNIWSEVSLRNKDILNFDR